MKVIVSSENPDVVYLDFPTIRIIYRNGEYDGWYVHTDGSETSKRERESVRDFLKSTVETTE